MVISSSSRAPRPLFFFSPNQHLQPMVVGCLLLLLLPLLLLLQGVEGQLYTRFEDVVEAHPRIPIRNPDHGEPMYEYDSETTAVPPTRPAVGVTCMARQPHIWAEDYPWVLENWDYYRTGHTAFTYTNLNPRYFCSNVPQFSMVSAAAGGGGGGAGYSPAARLRGHRTPYSQFWLNETTAWYWRARLGWRPKGGQPFTPSTAAMASKDRGFIFRVDVTGIKSRGRFLKGWYHLKITLDIDHNVANQAKLKDAPDNGAAEMKKMKDYRIYPATSDEIAALKANYIITKLMVTARGRTLAPGRPRVATPVGLPYPALIRYAKRAARRTWVGGIGEFVQDFPKCQEPKYNNKHPFIQQQFMPCGSVQYSESTYGNNFYYTRTKYPRYGNPDPEPVREIHLNFRLDNSFCNRYYDIDFVANGIVMHKDNALEEDDDTVTDKFLTNIFIVQRSISTRFVFASSFPHHAPTYYENADPIPRGVDSVSCGDELKAEWEMNPRVVNPRPTTVSDPIKEHFPVGRKDNVFHTADKHTMSVTKGTDLKVTNAPADATFGGAIKFIYKIPEKLDRLKAHDYTLGPQPDNKNSEEDRAKFGARRTWTYAQRLMPSVGDGIPDMWSHWADRLELSLDPDKASYNARNNVAVQRVLNEFDWETYLEELKFYPFSSELDKQKCNVGFFSSKDLVTIEIWPHPYYDITCIGLNAMQSSANPPYYELREIVRQSVQQRTGSQTPTRGPTTLEAKFPSITGRCPTSLYYTDGIGSRRHIPPPCDEFFKEYKNDETKDPALGVIVKNVEKLLDPNKGNRKSFHKRFVNNKEQTDARDLLCKYQEDLRATLEASSLRECPTIPPKPYTPLPPGSPEASIKMKKDSKAKQKFKTTGAYKRGMVVSESPYTLYIWDARLFHGVFMTILVMWVTPISIFLTRYFKETFMNNRFFLHHIWYMVHIAAAIATPLLFLVGFWRIVECRSLLGLSMDKSAIAHRKMGWIAVGIACFLFLTGGCRCVNRPLRGVMIFIHFVLGFAFYGICLALVMTSISIPGCPSAFSDFSINAFEMKNLKEEAIFILVFIWILLDAIVHIVMTVMQCVYDRQMKLTRARVCFGSPMPVIAETYRFDTPGRFFRIYMLYFYLAVSTLTTILIICFLFGHSPRKRGFGFMTCTHTYTKGGTPPQPDVNLEFSPACM